YFGQLIEERRACIMKAVEAGLRPVSERGHRPPSTNIGAEVGFWVAAERLPQLKEVYPEAVFEPEIQIPERLLAKKWERDTALVEIIRGRMESSGPVTVNELASSLCLNDEDVDAALIKLEGEGFVFRGKF